MSMKHLKLSLVNTNNSVGMSRREIKLNQTSQQTDCVVQEKLFTISVGTQQLHPHWTAHPHVARSTCQVHCPEWHIRTSAQSWCGARRRAERILCFRCILTWAQSALTGWYMDPVLISAGNLSPRAPGLGRPALRAQQLNCSHPLAWHWHRRRWQKTWIGVVFALVSSSVGSVQRTAIGIKGFAVRKIKKPKGRWLVWKTSSLFTSTPFSFFLSIWDFGSTVAWKLLKVERRGHSHKDTHWTRFQHPMKMILQPAVVACSGLLLCVGFRFMQPILTQKTLWFPAIINGLTELFSSPVYIYTFLSG